MRLKFILLAISAFANLTFAQILTKDALFATNGVYTSTASYSPGSPYDYFTGHAQSADGSIYFTYTSTPTITATTTVLSKLTSNGILDTSFGNNGELVFNNSPYNETSLTTQSDNKIVLVCSHSDASNNYADVIRVLPNGQLDNTFGNNGIVSVPDLFYNENTGELLGLRLQNNKIIVYGRSMQNQSDYLIYSLNANGSIDTTFGNAGKITSTDFNFLFIDNQLNIVTFSDSDIKKYNPNGQPLTSYGNNGAQTLNSPFVFNNFARRAILDSSNRILYLESASEEIKRVNSDGTLDSTFYYDAYPNGLPRLVNNLYEKDGFYYVCGFGELPNGQSYFISRLDHNGIVDPTFGSFMETDPAFNGGVLGDMIINDNSFIVVEAGQNRIVKYLKNNATLSANENYRNTEIQFENPVKDQLVYKTKGKIKNIEIYSIAGMLIKTLENNSTDVTTLLKGNYIAKVNFQNGKTKTVKIVKK